MPNLHELGKPHIFLLDPPEREKATAAYYTKDAEAIEEYARLIDAIVPVVESRVLTTLALPELERAFRSRHKIVWNKAGRFLVQLSHYFAPVLSRFLALADDSSAQIRLRVIQSQWTDQLPAPQLPLLLLRALNDKAPRVRLFAADRIEQFRVTSLLPELERRHALETHPGARTALEDAIRALRPGAV
jgi:hypothetical protein